MTDNENRLREKYPIEDISRLLRSVAADYFFTTDTRVVAKDDSLVNFVTDTDLAVQQKIIAGLKELTPGVEVIAEENDEQPDIHARPVWILDPIDGTTNFMRGLNHSAVSLALVQGSRPLLAFIYNPYLKELFFAADQQGAFLNGRPILVSPRNQLRESLIGFGTNPYARQDAQLTFDLTAAVFRRSLEVRRSGSAALDLAYVAAGRLDAFFEQNLQTWDYAAGALLIKEAGGRLTNWCGQTPDFKKEDSILASNGKIHAVLSEFIEQYFGKAKDC